MEQFENSPEDQLFELINNNFVDLINNKIDIINKITELVKKPINFNYMHDDESLLAKVCFFVKDLNLWKIIVEHELDFNLPNSIGATPLIVICECIQDIEIWKLISKFKLDFNALTTEHKKITSPFVSACKKITNPEIWKIILSYPIEFTPSKSTYYAPILSVFDMVRDPVIIQLILNKAIESKLDFNLPNCYGFTPAHPLCWKSHSIEIWKIMLEQNINLNIKSNNDSWSIDYNSTPLTVLCNKNNLDLKIWELIFSSIPDLNFTDKNYWSRSPISNAFKYITNFNILKLFVERNVKILDRGLFKLIENPELQTQIKEYYFNLYKNLQIKKITLDSIYTQYLDWVQSDIISKGEIITYKLVNSLDLFVCSQGIGSRGYYMPFAIPEEHSYRSYFQIADNIRDYPNGYFPIGFYNPHQKEINFGLVFNNQFCGNYKLKPLENCLIFNQTIIPCIPKYPTKMVVLVENKKLEPDIIYCVLPWIQIDNLLEELDNKQINLIRTTCDKEFNFEIIKNEDDNMILV